MLTATLCGGARSVAARQSVCTLLLVLAEMLQDLEDTENRIAVILDGGTGALSQLSNTNGVSVVDNQIKPVNGREATQETSPRDVR